jgi:hypothetical protein
LSVAYRAVSTVCPSLMRGDSRLSSLQRRREDDLAGEPRDDAGSRTRLASLFRGALGQMMASLTYNEGIRA